MMLQWFSMGHMLGLAKVVAIPQLCYGFLG
jgi:hypothetical protein